MKTTFWKRLAAAALSVMMLASLTACGGDSASQAAASSAAATEAPKTEASTAAAPAPEQASVAEVPDSTADAPAASEDLKEKWASLKGKTLKVATSGQQAGWSQDDGNGGVEGMDIDVMEYICDYYGINLEWIVADPTGIWGMLQSGGLTPLPALPPSTRIVWALTGSPTPTPGSPTASFPAQRTACLRLAIWTSGTARPSAPLPAPTLL